MKKTQVSKMLLLTVLVLTTTVKADVRGRLEGFIKEVENYKQENQKSLGNLNAKVKALDELRANLEAEKEALRKQQEAEAKKAADLLVQNETLQKSSNFLGQFTVMVNALTEIIARFNTSHDKLDKTADRLEKVEANLNKLLSMGEEVMKTGNR